ncbi:MAG: hypothetical protein QM496_17535, partial [Verrucomicrobiota bacterium]
NDRRDRNQGSRGQRRNDHKPMRAEDIVPQVDFVVEPTKEAVQALCKHIRSTNRAYAMAEVAKMVLASADRYRVTFRAKSSKTEKAIRMVRCKIDGSVWLSREEAVAHFLNTPDLLKEFYQVEEVKTEAPKGNFSVIAVCGLSGTILGPPNHHEYQQNINTLHRERFGNMPLERFKSRIEMRRDEETVEQWKELMSTSKHYQVVNKKAKAEAEAKQTSDQQSQDPVTEGSSVESSKQKTASETPQEEAVVDAKDKDVQNNDAEEVAPTDNENQSPSEEPVADSLSEENADLEKNVSTDDAQDAQASAGGTSDDESGEKTESPDEKPVEPPITSMTELTRHFREHFARRIFKEVGETRLAGNVAKNELSPALFERMNAEINWQKRGFPLPMVRTLCRRFEHQGLKFFKRGAKELFVSAARPRALAEDTVLTDRLLVMLNYIKDKPGTLAGDLIKHLHTQTAADAAPSAVKKDQTPDTPSDTDTSTASEPTKSELALLADLRWLLAEGYLIEFPNAELLPGTAVNADKRKRRNKQRPKKKAVMKKKTVANTSTDKPKSPVLTAEPAKVQPKEDSQADKPKSQEKK